MGEDLASDIDKVMAAANKEMPEFNMLVDKYNNEKTIIKNNMEKLGNMFRNPHDVGNNMYEFFNYRLYLTDVRDSVRKVLNKYTRDKKQLLRETVDSFKMGKHTGTMFKGNISILPKNDMERTIYYDDASKNIDYEIEFINSYLSFVIDQVSLIDKHTFAFETLLKYYDKYVSKKA
jgi:hypothetical protein